MNPNIKPTDQAPLLAVIDPDAYAAGTYTTAWVNVGLVGAILATIALGDLGTNATVDAKLEQATSAAGAGAKDITGKAITQRTEAGGDGNQQAEINAKSDDLDVDNGFAWARLSVTIATAACDMGATLRGFYPRYRTADSPGDAASVVEIVG